MEKIANKNTIMLSLIKGDGMLFDYACTIEDPLFQELLKDMQKTDTEKISEYWKSVGGYISNSIKVVD